MDSSIQQSLMTGIFSESRVLLVDDHPVFREGLKIVVDSHPKLRVVAEAASLGEALHRLASSRVQLLITDLSLADGSGQELLERAFALYPLRAVVLSVSRQTSDVVGAIQAGASAYLTKSASREEILRALDEVLEGRSFIHPDVSEAVVGNMRAGSNAEVTPREHQVMDLLCRGYTPKEIGSELKLSISTVKTHMRNLYRKMKVSTRTQLVLKHRSND